MDRSLLFFIAIGVGFLYFITHFISGIQEDDNFQSQEYKAKHEFDHYQSVDSIGRSILDVTEAAPEVQLKAWNGSSLKTELIALFPDFSGMKTFVEERVRGEMLKHKLIVAIGDMEDEYLSGAINAEEVKRMLDALK